MKCDWYAATIPDNHQNIISFLTDNLDGTVKLGRNGMNGYSNKVFIDNSDTGIQLATVLFGGNNGAYPHAFATSDHAPDFMTLVRSHWEKHSVTRIDVAEDMDGGSSLFNDFSKNLVSFARKSRVSICTVGDWLTPEAKEGRTLYLGAKSSSTRIRLYEKGKQIAKELFTSKGFAIPPEFPIDWVRLELQLRPHKEQKLKAATETIENFWGYSGWTQCVADEILSVDVPRIKTNIWKKSEDESILQWVAKQYGNLFCRRFDVLGSWEEVGKEMGLYIEKLHKQRSLCKRH